MSLLRRLFHLLLVALSALVPVAAAAQAACTGLCLQQVTCSGGGTTSISGTVYAPNGVDPLPNVLVFIPNAAVAAFTPGVSCPVPGAPPSGSPLVGATTAADGTFHLTNVPVGTNIPLVIQAGRWRRQVVVPATASCADTAFSTRMPQNQTEGDIPLIAVATGKSDSVECVLRKVGVADSEFTDPTSTGRIHLYTGTGGPGAQIDVNTPSQSTLMDDATQLAKYDVLMLPCQGGATGQATTANLPNLLNYANAGGRIYASHYSYVWFSTNGAFASVANWPAKEVSANADGTATVNTGFASGQTLSDWLQVVGASISPGQVAVQAVSPQITGVNSPTQIWLTLNNAAEGNPVQQFTFNAPVGSVNQCGRVLFNEYHVETPASASNKGGGSSAVSFPAECSTGAMTSQEKLLEYSLFDLTSNGGAPTLTPTTLDFGQVPVGFTSAAKSFTWTNNSIFNAGVTSATVSGPFTVTGNSCADVASGASCQISVDFTPNAVGAATGTLTVVSSSSTLTASLTGTGVPPLTSTTTALTFPAMDVGASSSQTFTVTNSAAGAVSLSSVAVTGDFAITSGCGTTVAAYSSCVLTVTFTPTTYGSRTGTVSYGGGQVALTGTGLDFSVAVSPTSGTLIAGTNGAAGLAILPLGGFASSVTVSCTTNAPAATCVPTKTALVPAAGAGVSINFTTTSQYVIVGYSGSGRGLAALLAVCTGLLLWRRRVGARAVLASIVVAAMCGLAGGCSGKLPAENPSYTPPWSYGFTVTATDGFLTHSASYALKVTAN